MLVFIPLATLIVSIFLFRNLLDQDPSFSNGWREAFLAAVVVLGAVIALGSEVLSLLRAINQVGVTALWLVVFSLVLAFALKHRAFKQFECIGRDFLQSLRFILPPSFPYSMKRVKIYFPPQELGGDGSGVDESISGPPYRMGASESSRWSTTDRLFLVVSICIVSILFVVARIAPPNTNDSIGYHMSRVMHWIQNHGLTHYPTTIDRQLWMPPWAEMAVMQLYLFQGNDGFSNLVQWFSMGASLIAVSLIAKRLNASTTGQLFAVLFCVTIPMGILQATSTQTDYATALWLVILAYYSLLAHLRRLSRLEWVLLCLVVALGIFTKGTYYTFALPFLAWLLVSSLRRTGWRATVGYLFLGFIVVSAINASAWVRNITTYGFPLGPRQSIAVLSNDSLSPGILASNLIRNSTLHLGTPYGVVNGPIRELVELVHRVIGQDTQDPGTTLDEYRIKRYLHEDRAGNPFHFMLVPVTLLLLVVPSTGRWKSNGKLLFALVVLSTFLIFSAVYKWQSTGSRLLLPFFVAWAPLAGAAFERPGLHPFRIASAFVLIVGGVSPMISNPSRALLPLSPGFANLISTPRAELLFANWPEIMPAYLSLAMDIKERGCRDVGIKINPIDPEYPLWFLLASKNFDYRIEHLDAPSPSGQYSLQGFQPCAIVCTYCEEEYQYGLPLVSVYLGNFFLYISSAE